MITEPDPSAEQVRERLLGRLEAVLSLIERGAQNYVAEAGEPDQQVLERMGAAAILLARAAQGLSAPKQRLRLVPPC